MHDWMLKGFARKPEKERAKKGGLLVYRAWGGSSSEWGSGFFSLEKPKSVLDAELRYNIADWGNKIHFVSTFKIKEGFEYYIGPVAHGKADLSIPATQVYITSPFFSQVDKPGSFEILKHDFYVISQEGNA